HCLVSSPAPPRAPPSFPTRRSSDLAPRPRLPVQPAQQIPAAAADVDNVGGPVRGPRGVGQHVPGEQPAGPGEPAVDDRQLPEGRSEEHTSELQSLTNLVCRLLLEKK